MSVTVRALALALLVPAGVVAAQGPTIALAPTTLVFQAQPGSGTSPAQYVAVTNGGSGTLSGLTRTITYTSPRAGSDGVDVNWLSTAWVNGLTTAPTTLSLQTHATATLLAGTYTATVGIRSRGALNSPQSIAVRLTVGAGPVAITLTPTSHDFGSIGVGLTSAPQRFTIANSGLSATGPITSGGVAGANPGDFKGLASTCAPAGIAAGGSCYFDIAFVPQAQGLRTATFGIVISGTTLGATLRGSGVAAQWLSIKPANVDFGSVGVGVLSAPVVVTVTNNGKNTTGRLTLGKGGPHPNDFGAISSSSSCANLTAGLAAGASCTVEFAFVPGAAGPRSATITFSASPGGQVSVNLVGIGVPAHLTMTPTAHDFGSVGIGGASAAQAFTITNDGLAPSGSFTASGSFNTQILGGINAADFRADPNSSCAGLSGGLAPQQSCDIVLWFSPTGTGARSAGLGLTASPGGTVGAVLSGTGTTAQVIIVTPPSHDFGTFGGGLPSPTQRFVLTNPLPWPTGPMQPNGGVFGITGPLIGGANPGDFYVDPNSSCVQVLATGLPVGGSCYFDVTFLPTGLGARSAVLGFQMTPGGAVQIQFSGNSLATGFLTITPTTKDFGSVGIGGASAAQVFTITNQHPVLSSGPFTGPSGLPFGGFGAGGLIGPNAGDFRPDPTSSCATVGGGLAPQQSCEIVLWFSPTAAGSRSAALSLGATPGGNVQAALSGTGTTAQVILVTPPGHDYGDVGFGLSSPVQRFVLTNPLPWPTGPLQPLPGFGSGLGGILGGPNPGDFYFDPNSSCAQTLSVGLAAGASCYFDVTFIPLGLGPRSATLVFSMTPGGVVQIPFSGNGIAATLLTMVPSSVDFGVLDVGRTSAPRRVTLTNTGSIATGQLVPQGPGGANPADFNFTIVACAVNSSGALPPGGTCVFDVTFTPTDAGTRTASIGFAASPGGSATLQLTGEGQFQIAFITLAPQTYDFGTLAVGQSGTQKFIVTNQSPVAVDFANAGFALGTQYFNIFINPRTGCVSGTLPPGATCVVDVQFAPQAAGPFSDQLFVTTTFNDTAWATVRGVASPLGLTPTFVDFGTVPIYNTSPLHSFTVTNHGQTPTTIQSVAITGTGSFGLDPNTTPTPCLGLTLAPQQSCSFGVEYGAQVIEQASGTLTVRDFNGNTATSQLVARATDQPMLLVTPGQFDFGSGVVGQAGPPMVFTVTNTAGARSYVLTEFILLGPGASDFVLDKGTCDGASPGPGQSCTLSISHKPLSLGARSATLTVSATNDLSGSWQGTVVLTGTGVAAPAAVLALAPATFDFGAVPLFNTAEHAFTVTNTGQAPADLAGVSIVGPNSAGFGLAPNSTACLGVLDPQQSCTFHVRFSPSVIGPRNTILTMTDFAHDTATAPLAALGTDQPVLQVTSSVGFGSVVVGQTSPAIVFTVTNTAGARSYPLETFALSGLAASDYVVDPGSCKLASLDPAQACTMTVTFSPSLVGTRRATLTVAAVNDLSGSWQGSATLAGDGVPAPVTLAVTPASHDFGTVSLGQTRSTTFTVTNTTIGLILLNQIDFTGPDAADFAVDPSQPACATLLGPGGSCTFGVLFTPHAPGLRSATVTISEGPGTPSGSAALTGSGTAVAALVLTPASFDFGNRQVGFTAGGVFFFTVTNGGSAATGTLDQFSFTGLAAADFSISDQGCLGVSLAPGVSCTLSVQFIPQALGPRGATLTVGSSAGGSTASALVSGTGVAPAVLVVTPSSKDFGPVVVGQTSNVVTFTLTNTGPSDAGLYVTDSLLGVGSADYIFHPFACGSMSVGVGMSCTFQVSFKPTATGLRPATLVFVFQGGSASVNLTGTGTNSQFAILPDTFRFGAFPIGQSSAPATFTIFNAAAFPTGTINSFVLTGVGAASYSVAQGTCAGADLNPGASCTFSVTFTSQIPGGQPATLTVTTGVGFMGSTELRGFGLAPAVLTATPASHDFGWTLPGQGAGPATITVTNTGAGLSGVININSLVFSGPNATEFAYLDTSTCLLNNQLAPGASCTIDAFFFPQALGPRSATLTVTAFGAGGGSVPISLTGGMTPAGVLAIVPASKDFGTVPVGSWTLPEFFDVTNVGTTPTVLQGVGFQGTDPGDFAFEPGTWCGSGQILDVGVTCQVFLSFRPQSTGAKHADLVVQYDNGTVKASLAGTASPATSSAAAPAPFTAADAARDLLGVATLNDAQRHYLDQLGNRDGSYDLGDLLAHLDRNNLKLSPALLQGLARRKEGAQ